ncbi:MAG: iron-sulfur cluster insertion protein erpA [Chlamydiota bacterium]|jgi:iron-sulfur cluster assembly accessory protein
MDQTITRDMTIEEIFTRFPSKSQKLAQEMTNAGLHCVGCSASTYETVEVGMLGHGMADEEIDALLGRLNRILSEKEDLSAITLTPKAAKKFKEISEAEGKKGCALRFGLRAAGCSGFEYMLDFSDAPRTGDLVLESEGIAIHVLHKSADKLMGCVIDYADGLQGAGFKISNPNVKSSCGCGTSHGY